jgi:hypothetical protein
MNAQAHANHQTSHAYANTRHEGANFASTKRKKHNAYARDLVYGGALYEEVRDEMHILRLRDADRHSKAGPPR